LPPTRRAPASRAARAKRVEIRGRQRGRRFERQEREGRLAAHRREVARVDRERAAAEHRGRRPPGTEMDALEQRVRRQQQRTASRTDDGRIVAGADRDAARGRRRCETADDAPDPRMFADVAQEPRHARVSRART